MSNWTVGDWLTYGPIVLGALALALTQVVKDVQAPPDWIPSFLRSQKWNYAPLLLMFVGAAAYGARQLAPIARLLDGMPKVIVQSTQPPVQVPVSAPTQAPAAPIQSSSPQIKKYPPTDRDALLPALRRADDATDEFRHIMGAEQTELSTMLGGNGTTPTETLLSNFKAFLEKASKQQLKIANQFDGLRSYHQELEGLELLNPDESYGYAVDEYFHFLSFLTTNHAQPDPSLLSFQIQRLLKEVTGYAARISNYQGALKAKIKEIKENSL